jgi:hypothetical protein
MRQLFAYETNILKDISKADLPREGDIALFDIN